jgi:hypothetical protein
MRRIEGTKATAAAFRLLSIRCIAAREGLAP